MEEILLTGGTGYIGTHTAVSLLEKGYQVVVVDNLVNSSLDGIKKVEEITGKKVDVYIGDVRDENVLEKIFTEHKIAAVIHFAGLKAVGESVAKPLDYYGNNLDATINLLKSMIKYGVNHLVFSSSATVYSNDNAPERVEGMSLGCTNPYGWTKMMGEQIIRDSCAAYPQLQAIMLRYFNPVGAHPSGLIGESPNGIPNNLMPYIQQVAVGKREYLHVYGNDYDTPDGTGIRDYIHVCDLADAHVSAVNYLLKNNCCLELNIGTGRGTSVLELVKAFETANGIKIPYQIDPRRPGDIAICYGNPAKANQLLGWKATRTIEDCCRDAYRFQINESKKNK